MRQPALRSIAAARSLCFLLGLLFAIGPALAAPAQQEEVPIPPVGTPLSAKEEQSLVTLEALRGAIVAKQDDLDRKLAEVEKAKTDERRLELISDADELQADLDRLRINFESVATGIDYEAFHVGRREQIDLKAELLDLVAPILEELKSATETPRQIEDLRSSLAFFEQRQELARSAIAHIDELLATQPAEALRSELENSKSTWAAQLQEIESQETVARFQLEMRLENRRSAYESVKSALGEFFRTRGLNLVLAIGTAVLVFLGSRWLYRLILRLSPVRRRAERPFYARLVDVLFHGLTGVMSLLAAMGVLFATGDWVLLAIVMLFLLGIVWAGRATIPQFLEQIWILLNFGTVREQERVIYNGLPWRVSRIGVSAILTNPELSGGIVRLPVKELTGMRSRPCTTDDVWFPSRRNDYVRLSDGKAGQVIHQSPESVKLRVGGGAEVTYPTLDYLRLCPENLSTGFSVTEIFGIDYRHQAIGTTRVPEIMRARVEAGLLQVVSREELTRLSVEFKSASASSLDYSISASFKGTLADRAEAMRRLIQRLLVEVCQQEGWSIPFPQVTVHQAPGSSAPLDAQSLAAAASSSSQRPQSSR